MGWEVRDFGAGGRNTWHTGSLPGTYAVLVRWRNGVSWVALFNQRDDLSGLSYADIDSLMDQAAGSIVRWPGDDLFGRFLYDNPNYRSVQESYLAYYGRPADPGGLDFWAGQVNIARRDLGAIIDAFGTSEEFLARFGQLDTATLINNIYLNLFGRNAETEGLNWWVEQYQNGTYTLPNIALAVLYGAQGGDATRVNNKRAIADYYTLKVRNGCTYDYDDAVAVIQGIDESPDTVHAGKSTIDQLCGD